MKKILKFIGGAFLVMIIGSVVLVSCSSGSSSSKDEVKLAEPKAGVEANTDTPKKEKEETKSTIGKRTNPVLLGETVEFPVKYSNEDWTETYEGRATMTISNIIRGDEAYQTLINENQFNEAAPEGYEWMIFTIDMSLVSGDQDEPYVPMDMFAIIDAGGSEIPQDIYGTFDGNEFGYAKMFPEGSSTGRKAKLVKVGEDPLIVYQEGFIGDYYFASK